MRLSLFAAAVTLVALPALAQTPPTEQDWQSMAASLQQQLMDAMSARMQNDTKMLKQLQAASARAAVAEAKLVEMEKKGVGPQPAPAASAVPAK